MAYYKLLCGDRSYDGEKRTWSLPTADGPGEWQTSRQGFHLTRDPAKWFRPSSAVYLAEYRNRLVGPDDPEDPDEIFVRECRLIRPLTEAELAALRIYFDGDHELTEGACVASGGARVTVSGSATVTAYDSATVTAYGSAKVAATGSASVTAYDSAIVVATGSATVTAYDFVTVTAYDSVTVTAYDSVTVAATGSVTAVAYGSAKVMAYDSARVMVYGSAKVENYEFGVLI
jgi:hypothetical protein